jgi:fructose-bisphosphate aldolase class II
VLVPLPNLLASARDGEYALGYFEAWDSYSLEAVIEAAEAERAPVILGFGCMMVDRAWLDVGGIRTLGCIGRSVAEQTQLPVSLLLNEAHTYEEAIEGIHAGFNAVMLDTSRWPWKEALTAVARLVRVAHARGVAVEGEFGCLPDAIDGGIDNSTAQLTDPDRAATFASHTGVDCLAVAIGNVHLLPEASPPVDLTLLEAIHDRVRLPLVIHGGSSFPREAVPQAIAHGAVKFNVGTILKRSFLDGIRDSVQGWPTDVRVHDVLGSHRDADFMVAGKVRMRSKARELLRLYGSSGRAGAGGP